MVEPIHAAYLASLQGALVCLLNELNSDHQSLVADGLTVHLELDGGVYSVDIEYTKQGIPVAGEGL